MDVLHFGSSVAKDHCHQLMADVVTSALCLNQSNGCACKCRCSSTGGR